MASQLRTMSVAKLTALRSQVEAVLKTKVADRRRLLESELAKLNVFNRGSARAKRAGAYDARGKVAPKYRNPENPIETWAGRGLKPRWLTTALKAGQNLEDFSIAGAASNGGAKKTRKVGGRAGK